MAKDYPPSIGDTPCSDKESATKYSHRARSIGYSILDERVRINLLEISELVETATALLDSQSKAVTHIKILHSRSEIQ